MEGCQTGARSFTKGHRRAAPARGLKRARRPCIPHVVSARSCEEGARMPLDLNGASGFSAPLAGSLYLRPPRHFHGAKLAWATYETDAAAVAALLPPAVRADGDPPVAELRV